MSTTEAAVDSSVTPTSSEDRFYGKEAPVSEPAIPAKQAESEPAIPSEARTAETAPESEPGETRTEEPKDTPEARSERDHDSQLKRLHKSNTRLNRELGASRAETRRYQEELAELRKGVRQPEPAPGHTDGEPQLEDYETHEAWKKDFVSFQQSQARANFEREQQLNREREDIEATQQTWGEKKAQYLKSKSDNPEAEAEFRADQTHVVGSLKNTPANRVLAEYLLDSDSGPEMIVHLADNDKDLKELANAATFRAANKIIDRIDSVLKTPKVPPPNTSRAPKIPSTVSGNGSTVTKLTREEKFYGKE
jgi:hypothetical protein